MELLYSRLCTRPLQILSLDQPPSCSRRPAASSRGLHSMSLCGCTCSTCSSNQPIAAVTCEAEGHAYTAWLSRSWNVSRCHNVPEPSLIWWRLPRPNARKNCPSPGPWVPNFRMVRERGCTVTLPDHCLHAAQSLQYRGSAIPIYALRRLASFSCLNTT